MFYFSLNINYFISATRHLTPLEVGIYTSLMLHYYQTEHPIKADELDKLYRKLSIKSEDLQKIVKDLLDEFCELKEGYYHWNQIDVDVAKYKKNIEFKSDAGKKSAESRRKNQFKTKENVNTCSTGVDNQEPTTEEPTNINQKSLNNKSEQHVILDTLALDDLLKLWNPELDEVNRYLNASDLPNLNFEEFNRIKLNFLSFYSNDIKMKKLDGTKLIGKFVTWIQRQKGWNESKLDNSKGKSPWDINNQNLEVLV